jgi:hypothetical protein
MTVIISHNATLTAGTDYTANNPLIGYENLTTFSNVTATSEDANYPATNLANPATNLIWKAEDVSPIGDIYLTVVIDRVDPVDYVAIAKHNLGTSFVPVSIEGQATSGGAWVELVPDVLLVDDGPALFQFAAQSLYAVRVRLQQSSTAAVPQIAVLYTGKLLVLQRRIYVGHTPITQGRSSRVVNAKSESGQFLGRIVLSEYSSSGFTLQNLDKTWLRNCLLPFIRASKDTPFFFAWRPSDFPYEIGYCWMTIDPRPANQLSNGMMTCAFEFMGVI